LEPRTKFATTFEATYGGIEETKTREVAIFHMLESWPKDRVPNPLYTDLRQRGEDPVAVILQALLGAEEEEEADDIEAAALGLLQRAERGWYPPPGAVDGRRDCRTTYLHGR